MTNNDYYLDFINKIKEKTPPGVTLANYLIDLLFLSRESVYRRLRGEVPFTLDEVFMLAKHFGISLDEILKSKEYVELWDKNSSPLLTYQDVYKDMLKRYTRFLNTVSDDPTVEYYSASNTIHSAFLINYENLLKFRLCKQASYESNTSFVSTLNDIKVPQELIDVHNQLCDRIMQLPIVNFIWDSMIFMSFVNDVKYFYELKAITHHEVLIVHDELIDLINVLEDSASKGEFPNGHTFQIYISSVNFDVNYSYIERADIGSPFSNGNTIGYIDSTSYKMNIFQKNWISSLMRHSTLISKSGEVERIRFFKKQRELIDTLLDLE